MSRKRLSGILIAGLVLVAVNLPSNEGLRSAFGGYGDRNKYTTQMERHLKTLNKKLGEDYFLAVYEGKSNTVVVITVSHLWSGKSAESRKRLHNYLSELWVSVRDPRDELLRKEVVIVDESGNKLTE